MSVTAVELLDPIRRVPCDVPPSLSHRPGLYALFMRPSRPEAWHEIGLFARADSLLYIGVATTALADRYHPGEGSCRISSPRFSFGALLRVHCGLAMKPAKPGQTKHWHFEHDSELDLSAWLRENLTYCGVEWETPKAALEARERYLISQLDPLLNLKHAPSDRSFVKSKRNECRQIARALRDQSCGKIYP